MSGPRTWPDGSEQLPLFDAHGAPYVAGSDTSRAAAVWADASGLVTTARAEVLRLLMDLGRALTDEEIAEALAMSPNTARPRRVELVELGLVAPDGEGVTRAGRRAVRWRATVREVAS